MSANVNAVAKKFKYNGVELEESLGLNLYKMDFRQYDPAIARFTSIDPVTHHSMSTYTAFDNNPVYWADPSGANSIYNFDTSKYVINGKEVTQEEAIAYANNGGNADNSNDNVINGNENELNMIADDLNSIYNDKYGKSPFTVEKQKRTKTVVTKPGGWFGDDETKEVEYDVYVLVGSIGFNWNTDNYTKMMYGILTADVDILVDMIQDNGTLFHKHVEYAYKSFLKERAGGYTVNNQHVVISDALSTFNGSDFPNKHTIGGITLHELLRHIHPNGNIDESVNKMRNYYKLKGGSNHDGFDRFNILIPRIK